MDRDEPPSRPSFTVAVQLCALRAKVIEQFDPKGDTMNINGRLCSFARILGCRVMIRAIWIEPKVVDGHQYLHV